MNEVKVDSGLARGGWCRWRMARHCGGATPILCQTEVRQMTHHGGLVYKPNYMSISWALSNQNPEWGNQLIKKICKP